MNDSLSGTTALVTGSSRNLGAEVARELARQGARVVVTHRASPEEAAAVLESLPTVDGGDHLVMQCDLAAADGADRLAREALATCGRVDVLVNNLGPFSMTPFAELPEAEWDHVWVTNVRAAWLLARSFAPGMRDGGRGRIVNVSAGSAYLRNHSIYTLAKAALLTLTEELAVELGPAITVNAITPGQLAESADDIAAFDPGFVARAIEATPLGRLAHRRDVARIIAEVCGPRFGMVTGATIPVDGGWHLPRF